MATRILAAYYLLEQDESDFPETNFDAFRPDDPFNLHIDVQKPDHEQLSSFPPRPITFPRTC